MDLEGINTKWNQTEILLTCGISKNKKQKQTNRYREQTGGYQKSVR